MKPVIFITRKLPEIAMERIAQRFEIIENPYDEAVPREELISGVKECDILLCMLSEKIDREVIDANPNLKGIVNYAVGFNNIDIAYATQKSIPVTNTPDVLTDATADVAWALLFACARRVVEADRFTREGKFHGWSPLLFLGADITGKTLGIVGTGRIGTAMAKRAVGFDMNIIYCSNSPNFLLERDYNAKFCPLDLLLEMSDFVSLHVPLTAQTNHLIGIKEFVKMKNSAILINTARGPVVDERALYHALEDGEIAAAGLDVYEDEPDIYPGLEKLDNVVLLPHVGSATIDTRNNMGLMCAENAIAIIEGFIPPQVVNPDYRKHV